jgi:hypothetical protein
MCCFSSNYKGVRSKTGWFRIRIMCLSGAKVVNQHGQSYFGWSEEWSYRKWHHRKRPWPEMTSPEVMWPVVTWPEVTSRKWSHAHVQPVPALFSYYSSSTKCIIAHDRHGYRKWRDRRSRDSDVSHGSYRVRMRNRFPRFFLI